MNFLDVLSSADNTSTILELKSQFEKNGLTVQQAASGKIFICCIQDGKPCHDEIYEDHFPVGMPNNPLSDRALTSIIEFVLTNRNDPQALRDDGARGNYGLYGSSIRDNQIGEALISEIDKFLHDG